MQTQLSKIKNALISVSGLSVSHYQALKKTPPYCVWAEDGGAGQLSADNAMQEQTVSGVIDYYTKTESDPNVEAIQTAMQNAKISFRLYLVQYEEETKCIHYTWEFEV